MTKSTGKYWAGRVCAFLSHSLPGFEDCDLSDEADLAEVAWFAEAVPGEGVSNGMADSPGCRVFKSLAGRPHGRSSANR